MPAQTILDMTQTILSSLSSDEVNSISDTAESMSVARILKQVYEHIAATADLPETFTLFQLTASGSNLKPAVMYLPTNSRSLEWLKYNKATDDDSVAQFTELKFLALNDFLERQHLLRTDADNVGSMSLTNSEGDSMTFYYEDDRGPTYYTTFDDYTILFDAYDSAVDTTLQRTKTLGYGELSQLFQLTDSFTPPLDEQHTNIMLNEAKSLAFIELKQTPHPKAEQMARKGWIGLQRTKKAIRDPLEQFNSLPNYGRK